MMAPVEPPAAVVKLAGGRRGAAAAQVRDVEITSRIDDVPASDEQGRRTPRAWLLVRLCTEPVGFVKVDVPDSGLPAADVVSAITAGCGEVLRGRLGSVELTVDGLPAGGGTDFVTRRGTILADAPHITVVICTRERPDGLRRTIRSLELQEYPSFDVVVVDNAPTTAETRCLVEGLPYAVSVRYLLEPRPGLSRARNRALRELTSGIVAWLDDDEEADSHWLAEIARGFADNPEACAVSGVVVPARLDTAAQVWFEQFGGHSKGRGFDSVTFSPRTAKQQSPLYPLPPFGVGANMAFRVEALQEIGGFDEALGAGTLTRAGEDTLVFTQLLVAGATTVYQHSAVTRHHHRSDLVGLNEQLAGYGTGLTAFYTALLLWRPALVWRLIALAPRARRDMAGGRLDLGDLGEDFPSGLLDRNRRGMLAGPLLYLRARFSSRNSRRRKSR